MIGTILVLLLLVPVLVRAPRLIAATLAFIYGLLAGLFSSKDS